jgi:hypothetical protein
VAARDGEDPISINPKKSEEEAHYWVGHKAHCGLSLVWVVNSKLAFDGIKIYEDG